MKYIQLTSSRRRKNQSALAIVSDEDYEEVSKFKWTRTHTERRSGGYAFSNVDGKRISMHRFVMGNIPDGLEVDHINGNGLDNRRENLRIVTRQQNIFNRRTFKNSNTGLRGISQMQNGKYQVCIRVQLETIDRAAEMYRRLAPIAFGEYAYSVREVEKC